MHAGDEGDRIYEIGGAERVSLRRSHAGVRATARAAPHHAAGSGADTAAQQPLARPRDPALRAGGRSLIESIPHETVVRDSRAPERLPDRAEERRQAIDRRSRTRITIRARRAGPTRSPLVATRASLGSDGGMRHPRRLVDSRHCDPRRSTGAGLRSDPPDRRRSGWYAYDGLWRLRGFLDLLVGGVGMRRGLAAIPSSRRRRHAGLVACGGLRTRPPAATACRDEAAGAGLARVRGEAVAEGSRLHQTAVFDPSGLSGLIYWYAIAASPHAGVPRPAGGHCSRGAGRRPDAPAAAMRPLAALLLLLLLANPARGEAPMLTRADALWARRSEGQVDAVARSAPARAAIDAYEQAIAAEPGNFEAYWQLLRALWFSADLQQHGRGPGAPDLRAGAGRRRARFRTAGRSGSAAARR